MIETLSSQSPTPETKKLQALIKQALYADDLMDLLNEVRMAFNGCGKVSTDTVKGAIEYAKAHNEVQIRSTDCSDEQKDEMVQQESDRLKRVEVWLLGALAYWGLLK